MRMLGMAILGVSACGPVSGSPNQGPDAGSSSSETGADSDSGPLPSTTSGVEMTSDDGDESFVCDFPPWTSSGSDDGGPCLPWATQGCALARPAASMVAGQTPLGDDGLFSHAVFASHMWCDECVSSSSIDRIIFVEDLDVLVGLEPWEMPPDGLVLDLDDFEGPLGEPTPGSLSAYRDGELLGTTECTISIAGLPDPAALAEPYDEANPATVQGTVSASGGGWNLEGSFDAAYCPQVNEFAICE